MRRHPLSSENCQRVEGLLAAYRSDPLYVVTQEEAHLLMDLLDADTNALALQRDALIATLGRIRAAAKSDADIEGTALQDFLLRETEAASLPDLVSTTYQWLVERGQPEGLVNAVWLEHSSRHPARDREWTTNAREAAMFPSRKAAERYIVDEDLDARAVEHGFMS